MTKHCGIKFSAKLLHPRCWLSWLGLGIFSMVALFPTRLRHRLGLILGRAIYNKKDQKRRKVVSANLQVAFPHLNQQQLDTMTLEHLQWYGCAMIDYSLLFFASQKRINKQLKIDGKEHIDRALENNQNIIILLAHSVMLEFGPAALNLHYQSFGSYKTSKNPVIDWMIAKSRCRHVDFVVSREEGLRKLIKSLTPKKLMIFLPDEDLGIENSTFANFFNKPKATLTTTARIAKMGKATALPAYTWFDPNTQKYTLQILPALENYPSGNAEADALALNQALEKLVKISPEQYMWLMRLYKTRPNNEAGIY